MVTFEHNKKLSILGHTKTIHFNTTKSIKPLVIEKEDSVEVYQGEVSALNHKLILRKWLVEKTRKIISDRVSFFAKKYNFEFNKISIKEQSSRWGSCSSKKNLNFNWKLLLTSTHCLDYVVVHELCHLKQMNHSQKFWDLVEEIFPDYKEAKNELREFERKFSGKYADSEKY